MEQIKKSFPDCLFEVSWEVCNKIGGIHTVLSTKSALVEEELKKNYITVGPDVWMDTEQNPEFTEDKSLFRPWKQKLSQEGLNVRIGRWNIPGNPVAFLVDFTPYISRKDEILTSMWKKFGVDSLTGNWDYIEAALFGYASGMVIESFVKFNLSPHNKVVAHFHEWMTGAGLLYIKERNLPVATVFTTHATVLGRCLAGNNLPLYSGLDNYVPDDKARELGVQARHSLEKQSAANADVFTTVSGITARECARFLGKEPDIITPNGFSEELAPSDTARMDFNRLAGLVTEKGSITSHVCIIARNKGIAAMTGVRDCMSRIHDGDCIIIDGPGAKVIVNPDGTVLRSYRELIAHYAETRSAAARSSHEPAVTLDGKRIYVEGNAGNVNDVRTAIEAGADGIGLLRSEFLYMESSDFQPALTLDPQTVTDLFEKEAPKVNMFTKDSPDELKPKLK